MNNKLSNIILCFVVALAGIPTQGSAAVALPTATTPSDVIFYAIDQASGNSFVFDLGTPSGLATLNQNITGAAWNAYLTAEGNSLANTTWGLAYVQGTKGANSLWGTTVTAGFTIGTETAAKMSAGRLAFNSFLNLTAMTTAGTSAYTNAANAGNFTNGMINSWGGNASGWTTDNAIGTAANFYTVTAASSANGGTLVASGLTFNGTGFSLDPPPYFSSSTPTGGTIGFGQVAANATGHATLSVSNLSFDSPFFPLILKGATITGKDAKYFSLGNFVSGMSIPSICRTPPCASNSFDLDLLFQGDKAGVYDALLTLDTNSGNAISGSTLFSFNLNAIVPVPEPETYAMFLAGLGLMGFAARRRKAS
jgi:hypothetical protein